jgi:hypothetical protein
MTTKTTHALEQIANYLKPGTNEGISWTLARVTDTLFDDSLLAGGDASRYEAHGKRGRVQAQLSHAYLLAPGGGDGPAAVVPVELSLDLDDGVVRLSWKSWEGSAHQAHFTVALDETTEHSTRLTFHGQHASDGAGWVLRLMLL